MRSIIEQLQRCINGTFEFSRQLTRRTYWRAVMFSFFATAIILALSFALYYFYLSYLGVDQPTDVYSMMDYFAFGNSLFEFVFELSYGLGILTLVYFPFFSGIQTRNSSLDGFESSDEKNMEIPVFVVVGYIIIVWFLNADMVHVQTGGQLYDYLISFGLSAEYLGEFLSAYFRVILTWLRLLGTIFLLVVMYRAIHNYDKIPLKLSSKQIICSAFLLISVLVVYEFVDDFMSSVFVSFSNYLFHHGAVAIVIDLGLKFLLHAGFILAVYAILEADLKLWKEGQIEQKPIEDPFVNQ